MKRTFIFFAGVLLSLSLFAQESSKLDVGLMELNSNQTTLKTTVTSKLNVFIYGNSDAIVKLVEDNRGTVNTATPNIVTAVITNEALNKIAESNDVTRIQIARETTPLNNEAIKNINADKVHSGTTPLDKNYNGEGVIVGIIDSGIDFQHEDFRNPENNEKSRILYLWDQTKSDGVNPSDFSYGSYWTKDDIESSLDQTNPTVSHKDAGSGHGTHVSGTAAGNLGIAPKADIIVVGLDFSKSTGIADAANFIFKKADELGKPCVINASLGGHFSTHDGTSPEELIIDHLVNEKPGRVFVAAAGNEGGDYIHFGGTELRDEEAWTWYYPALRNGAFAGRVYGTVKNEDLDNLEIAFGLDSTFLDLSNNVFKPVKFMGKSEYKSLSDCVGKTLSFKFSYDDNSEAGEVRIACSRINDDISEFYILIDESANSALPNYGWDYYRFYIKGTGTINSWVIAGYSDPNPAVNNVTPDPNFTPTDNSYSVGSPATGKEIISVGAYVNRTTWDTPQGRVGVNSSIRKGEIAGFSSIGPSVDGRVKPEITAPGHYVMSALSHFVTPQNELDLSPDRKHTIMSGTSMASPVVTGAIALIMQQNPNLTNREIRDKLFNSTIKDSFTGDLSTPSNTWGYGKLDIFEAMSSTDSEEVQSVSVIENEMISAYPNPFDGKLHIRLHDNSKENKISIYDLLGNKIYETVVNNGVSQLIWDSSKMTSGLYFITTNSGNKYSTIKVIKK
ncbi:MAG: S8 family peptidase [Hyphomicrobiales bacterium]